MLQVADGVGVNSTAALVGMAKQGIRPDRIMFGDPGAEKDETYAYIAIMAEYLKSVDFPKVQIVRYVPKNFKNWPPYYSLEENCLTNGTLPSISFGFSSCSQKWKQDPQHKAMKADPEVQKVWATCAKCGGAEWNHTEGHCWNGDTFERQRVRKAIGYDATPRDRERQAKAEALVKTYRDDKAEFYDYWYPLQEWGWDRERCMEEIRSVGLPVPVKSSCFFCIAMKPEEVRQLSQSKLRRIVLMEARAKPRLTAAEGLWRKSTKTKPGSMTEFIRAEGLLSREEIERIQTVPAELVRFQKAYADGFERVPLGVWLRANFPEMYPPDPAGVEIVEVEYDEPEQTALFPVIQDGPTECFAGY